MLRDGVIHRSYLGYNSDTEQCEYVYTAEFSGPDKKSAVFDHLPSNYEIVGKWYWRESKDWDATFMVEED